MKFCLVLLLLIPLSILLYLIPTISIFTFCISLDEEKVLQEAQESLRIHENQSSTEQQIVIRLIDANFIPHPETGNQQVKVLVSYDVSNSSLIGQKTNAVLKVYSTNGSLLKTSSFPSGFTINSTGTTQLLTNIMNNYVRNITTLTTFTNQDKTIVLSNGLRAALDLRLVNTKK
jgi:hypothetical protein